MIAASLIATLATPSGGDEPFRALPRSARWMEVRARQAGNPGADWLRGRFNGELIHSAGHDDPSSDDDRHRGMIAAVAEYDMIDLDADRDLVPELLQHIPPEKRIISWRGAASSLRHLHEIFQRSSSIPAALYRLVADPRSINDVIAPLRLLKSLGRKDVTAYASGRSGAWSRLMAPHFGAAVVSGGVGEEDCEPGELTIARLVEDYDLPWLYPFDEIYGIVGNAVLRSLSPRLHNGAYRHLGKRSLYLPIHVEEFSDFHRAMGAGGSFESLGVRFAGGTISSPHKEAALVIASGSSALARRSGAVNNLVHRDGFWWGDTTDAAGALVPLGKLGLPINAQRILVVGCGGAGRTMAAALKRAGADVTLMNRSVERGEYASRLLGLPLMGLNDADIRNFSVVVNATPVGRDSDDAPFSLHRLGTNSAVIDLVYGSGPTALMRSARSRGMTVIDGRDVLRAQVYEQFRLLTGTRLPAEVMDSVLGPEMEMEGPLLAVSGA
ncbi:MAG: type I 3-dehydroquinate dehydratase [Candidatus Kapaibacterium sp.]